MDATANIGNCAWHRGDGWSVLAAGCRSVCSGVVARRPWRRQRANGADRGDRSCAGSLANRRNANGSGTGDHGRVGMRTIFVAEIFGTKVVDQADLATMLTASISQLTELTFSISSLLRSAAERYRTGCLR